MSRHRREVLSIIPRTADTLRDLLQPDPPSRAPHQHLRPGPCPSCHPSTYPAFSARHRRGTTP